MVVCKCVDQIDSAAMLAAKRSAGVTIEEPLRASNEACKKGNPPLQMSSEVQNRGISDPTKRTDILQFKKKKLL